MIKTKLTASKTEVSTPTQLLKAANGSAIIRAFLLAVIIGAGPLQKAKADYTTKPDPSTSYLHWDGWGTSLSWWANVFGSNNAVVDAVFTLNTTTVNGYSVPGLGFTIARYNLGGSCWDMCGGGYMQPSPNIPAFKQIQAYWVNNTNYNVNSSSWDWTHDAKQRAALLRANADGAEMFQLFANSPVWWQCLNSNPSGNGGSDNLKPWRNNDFAYSLAAVAKYAKTNWGVTFSFVEAFNEPTDAYWTPDGNQEGCHFDTGTQITVISNLNQQMINLGISSIGIAASDCLTYDEARTTWNSFDSTTKGKVDLINVHGYQYSDSGSARASLNSATAGKIIWNSEYSDPDATGMQMVGNLNKDIYYLHNIKAWCYWQAYDSGGWGLFAANPGDNWLGYPNIKWYMMAQYSRHIRGGQTNLLISSGDVNTVTAYQAVKSKLIIVSSNPSTNAAGVWITYDLSNFTTVNGPVNRWITVADGSEKYANHSGDTFLQPGKKFWSWFPPRSVQTFEVSNIVQ